MLKKTLVAIAAATLATMALAQQTPLTPVTIGMSGWTGFAPLTLAKEAGLFKKHGLDVTIKKIPQKDRHLAIASRRHPVRGDDRRDLDRLERQRHPDDADLPARQELRRRRHGGQARHRQDQ